MSSFKQFNSRKNADAGQRLVLVGPDGKPTEHWIQVRGVDSRLFQLAKRQARVDLLAFIEKHGPDSKGTTSYVELTEKTQLDMQVALVMGWSFDEPATPENVRELFDHEPSFAEQVDTFGGDRKKFASSLD